MTCACMREPDPGVCDKNCFGPRTAGHCRCCEGCADRPDPLPVVPARPTEYHNPDLEQRFANQMVAATELLAENEQLRERIAAAVPIAEHWSCDHDGFGQVLAALSGNPRSQT